MSIDISDLQGYEYGMGQWYFGIHFQCTSIYSWYLLNITIFSVKIVKYPHFCGYLLFLKNIQSSRILIIQHFNGESSRFKKTSSALESATSWKNLKCKFLLYPQGMGSLSCQDMVSLFPQAFLNNWKVKDIPWSYRQQLEKLSKSKSVARVL